MIKKASFSSTALICLESEYRQPVRLQTVLHIEPCLPEFADAIALGICRKTTDNILFNHSKALLVMQIRTKFFEVPTLAVNVGYI